MTSNRELFLLLGPASLEPAAETAAFQRGSDLGIIRGRYAEAVTPNSNGHVFPYEEFVEAVGDVPNRPLNVGHRPNAVVGHYMTADLQYPDGWTAPSAACPQCGEPFDGDHCAACGWGDDAEEVDVPNAVRMENAGAEDELGRRLAAGKASHLLAAYAKRSRKPSTRAWALNCQAGLTAAVQIDNPWLETTSALYRYYFPQVWSAAEKAFATGDLAQSMEAMPASLTCLADGCYATYEYAGRDSVTYECGHFDQPRAPRQLNDFRFTAGGLILPPTRPGWSKAQVTELAEKIDRYEEEAALIYEAVAAVISHGDARMWEETMLALVNESPFFRVA